VHEHRPVGPLDQLEHVTEPFDIGRAGHRGGRDLQAHEPLGQPVA
jgi:hypothetical protein